LFATNVADDGAFGAMVPESVVNPPLNGPSAAGTARIVPSTGIGDDERCDVRGQ